MQGRHERDEDRLDFGGRRDLRGGRGVALESVFQQLRVQGDQRHGRKEPAITQRALVNKKGAKKGGQTIRVSDFGEPPECNSP